MDEASNIIIGYYRYFIGHIHNHTHIYKTVHIIKIKSNRIGSKEGDTIKQNEIKFYCMDTFTEKFRMV